MKFRDIILTIFVGLLLLGFAAATRTFWGNVEVKGMLSGPSMDSLSTRIDSLSVGSGPASNIDLDSITYNASTGLFYAFVGGDTVTIYDPLAYRSLIREALLTYNVQDTSRYELVADDIGKRIKMLDTGNDTIDITSAFKAVADSGQTVSVHNLWGGTTLFRPPSGDSIKFGCDSIVSAFGTGMVEYLGNGLWYLYGKTE